MSIKALSVTCENLHSAILDEGILSKATITNNLHYMRK